ncbi:MAG: trypsin-like peptidase domain-containing protein, partial [Thermoguttaceae bacterium]
MVSLHAALAALALSGVGQTVFYDFYADWCAPCRAMDPTIQELVARGYPVERVNIDRNPQLAARYGVQSVPCYVMVVDGREVDRVQGGTTLSRLDRMCRLASTALSRSSMAESTRPSVPLPAVESRPPFSTTNTDPPITRSAVNPAVRQPKSQLPISSPGWAPKTTPDSHLLAASVRLRIEDPQGQSCGSGTIIDARQGEALILTCGHIFRDSQGRGPITVDLFGANPLKGVPGRLVSYDLKRDIGLVAIRVPGPLATVPVAEAGYRTAPNDAVVTVGCNNGDRPSARHSRVTVLNKFLGPDSLMVAGEPVEGRSGGGLFSADGRLIGVCNAADKEDREGLYAALASIHGELDRSGLTCIYNPTGAATAVASNNDLPRAA